MLLQRPGVITSIKFNAHVHSVFVITWPHAICKATVRSMSSMPLHGPVPWTSRRLW